MGKMYGTINVTEVRSKGIGGCEEHNRRQYEPGQMPKNIDPSRSHLNVESIAGNKDSFREAIDEKLEGLTVRKNAVIALEYILGASPEFFEKLSGNHRGYLKFCVDFVEQRHTQGSIVAINMHFDEKTPHVHVLVVPIVEKEVRWKNKTREGVNMERRLCARDFTGHPNMLRQLQKDFYEHIVPFGEFTGIEFTKYTSAQEQVKTYNERVDHRIDQVNNLAEQAQKQMLELTRQLEQTQQVLARLDVDLEKKKELAKQQAAALQREIEANQRVLRAKEEMDKELKAKREAEKRVTQIKKINKGNDRGQGYGGGHSM
jgi:hypothetical protein